MTERILLLAVVEHFVCSLQAGQFFQFFPVLLCLLFPVLCVDSAVSCCGWLGNCVSVYAFHSVVR